MVEGDGTSKEKVVIDEEDDVLAKLRSGGYQVGTEYDDEVEEGYSWSENDTFGLGEYNAASIAQQQLAYERSKQMFAGEQRHAKRSNSKWWLE